MSQLSTGSTSALDAYEHSLDGMRGVCIVAVVVYHACAVAGLDGWMRGGFIGVSVFFTLSGFLISSLLLREHGATGRIHLPSFWARRIRRLWPASFVVVLVVIILSATAPLSLRASDAVAATWNVTNWHVIGGGEGKLLQTIVGPLGPTWSLAVEEQFYIVLALLLVVVARQRRPEVVLTTIAVSGVLVPVVLSNVLTDWQPALEFNTLLRMPELFMGVLLAVWYGGGRRRVGGAATADVVAGAGLVVLVGLFLFVDYSPPWLLRGGYALVALVTALTIAGLLQRGRVAQLLSWPPLRWLGTVSFSLYLVHWPVMSVLTRNRTGYEGWLLVGIVVAVSVAVAWALHLFVERPVRRMRTAPATTIVAGGLSAVALTALSLVLL